MGSNDFSISAWFRTFNSSDYMAIFNKGEGTAIKPRIFIRTMAPFPNTFQWRVGDGLFNQTSTFNNPLYFYNKWHHTVLVKETTLPYFHLDGNLVSQSYVPQLATVNTNSPRPILLGAQDSVYSPNQLVPISNFFDGALDDFRIYNRAINPLEVDSLYHEPNPLYLSISLKENPTLISPNPVEDRFRINT